MTFIRNLFLNDKNILLLICINAIIIFLQGFPTINAKWHHLFIIVDDLISVIFATTSTAFTAACTEPGSTCAATIQAALVQSQIQQA